MPDDDRSPGPGAAGKLAYAAGGGVAAGHGTVEQISQIPAVAGDRAHVHPDHRASATVARHLDLAPTDVLVDGEIRYETHVGGLPATAPGADHRWR